MNNGLKMKKLGDCFTSIRNGANIKQYDDAVGIPITRIETLSNDLFNRDRLGYANIVDPSLFINFLLKDGDILMSHINSLKYLGRAVLYRKQGEEYIIHGMNLLRLLPDAHIIISSYINYFFATNNFKSQIGRIAKKSVNQASFTVSDLKEIKVGLPNLSAQVQIATTLDKASELVALRKKQLKELDALAESVFYDMFGDPVKNEKGWDIEILKNFGKISTGNTPSREEKKYYNDNYIEWIKSDNIMDENMLLSQAKEYLSEDGVLKGRIAKSGSILMTCIAGSLKSIGTVGIADRDVAFNQQINAIYPCKKVEKFYLYSMLKHSKQHIQSFASNGMKHLLNKSTFESIYFPIPPLPLQTQFATIIEKIEQQKILVRKALQKSEDLFQRLMQDLFNPD